MNLPPVVVFGFNRPHKLRRILDALRPQGIAQLVVYVDGPRGPHDQAGVAACQALARSVDWVATDLNFLEQNHGSRRLDRHIDHALERYPQAIFLEDDCLPMPGFYAFMRRALEQYQYSPQVFSIGAYQPLPAGFFKDYPWALVGSPRFTGWGWATWRDRWQESAAYRERFAELFDGLRQAPDIAGADLLNVAQLIRTGQPLDDWDYRCLVAGLWLKKIHLLPVRGLVRNIGLDRTGAHGSLSAWLRDLVFKNRNIAPDLPAGLRWPDDPQPDSDYAAALRESISRSLSFSPRRIAQRSRVLFRRYVWPRRERLFGVEVDMAGSSPSQPASQAGEGRGGVSSSIHHPALRRALLSYITYPFFIPRDDLRFLNHINIFHTQEMARGLNRMGYRVDVIDYRDRDYRLSYTYDLFVGHAAVNFEHIARQLPDSALKIYLSTGSYWQYHNAQEQQRFAAFAARRGVDLPPDRRITASEEAALRQAGGILGIGNQHTRSTYAGFERVAMVSGTTLNDVHFDWFPKDYDQGRRHFLFFSSGGNIHKGLDLVLEAFIGSGLELWVIAPLDAQFLKVYQADLQSSPNIHLLGRVQPRSGPFYQVMQRCNFCLLPSCSEGQAQSVIEAMNQGLVPLVSPQAGVDVDGFGFMLPDATVETIRAAVQEQAEMPVERCQQLSLLARQAAERDYSEAIFSENFRAALRSLGVPDFGE